MICTPFDVLDATFHPCATIANVALQRPPGASQQARNHLVTQAAVRASMSALAC